MLASSLFPDTFSAGEIYHSGEDFFMVTNPKFTTRFNNPTLVNYFGMLIVFRGQISGEIDGHSFHNTAKTSLAISAGQAPHITSCSEDLESVLLFFSPRVGDRIFFKSSYTVLQEIQREPLVVLDAYSMEVLRTIFTLFIQTLSCPRTNGMTDVYAMLLTVTFRMVAPDRFLHTRTGDALGSRPDKIMANFNSIVEKNYKKHRGVKFYADQLCLTPKYLSTTVKNATGKTANWWINYYVLRDAKRMLIEERKPVKEIASALNFGDQLLFGKYFRRQVGLSPVHYRAQNS